MEEDGNQRKRTKDVILNRTTGETDANQKNEKVRKHKDASAMMKSANTFRQKLPPPSLYRVL